MDLIRHLWIWRISGTRQLRLWIFISLSGGSRGSGNITLILRLFIFMHLFGGSLGPGNMKLIRRLVMSMHLSWGSLGPGNMKLISRLVTFMHLFGGSVGSGNITLTSRFGSGWSLECYYYTLANWLKWRWMFSFVLGEQNSWLNSDIENSLLLGQFWL